VKVGDPVFLMGHAVNVDAGQVLVELERSGARLSVAMDTLAGPTCPECGVDVERDEPHYHSNRCAMWPARDGVRRPTCPGTPIHMHHFTKDLRPSTPYPGCPVCPSPPSSRGVQRAGASLGAG